jgi:hypothetical protein
VAIELTQGKPALSPTTGCSGHLCAKYPEFFSDIGSVVVDESVLVQIAIQTVSVFQSEERCTNGGIDEETVSFGGDKADLELVLWMGFNECKCVPQSDCPGYFDMRPKDSAPEDFERIGHKN